MPIVVQKYGGSSVADVEQIKAVAKKVAARRRAGYDVVVVVSAMGDTTDELLGLAKRVSDNPQKRELDMLLTAGERISMALLSMALNADGVPAISFTGSQSGIITNDGHTVAHAPQPMQRCGSTLTRSPSEAIARVEQISMQDVHPVMPERLWAPRFSR